MKKVYRQLVMYFEKLTAIATTFLGDPITFFFAVCTVIFWFTNKQFHTEDIHARIGDIILGITFLSLFIIQKSFNRFSASLHLKVNELVVSHEPASNAVIDLETKTEHEIVELSKEYVEIIDKLDKIEEEISEKKSENWW